MSYDKYQSGRFIEVIPSDTIDIPTPADEKVNSTTTGTTANKLVDSAGDFINKKIQIGDIIYNTTDNTAATVTAIDSATTLSVSADIMATGEAYRLFGRKPKEEPVFYVGVTGDVAIETQNGDQATFVGVIGGSFLPVRGKKILATGTTATNIIALF